MSKGERPHGGDLLHLFTPWRQGNTILAGLAAFPPAPLVPDRFLADECTVDGCTTLIIGGSDEELAEHAVQHRRRCHG